MGTAGVRKPCIGAANRTKAGRDERGNYAPKESGMVLRENPLRENSRSLAA